MFEDAIGSKTVEDVLGVSRNFLRYHEDLFQPVTIDNRKIYSRKRVYAIYLKFTNMFPDAPEETKQGAASYQKAQLNSIV